MRKLFVPLVICLFFFLSGCTIAQFAYMRNLTEKSVEIYFDFDASALTKIPDSIYVPFSPISHPINRNTPKFMTDSIVARRYTGTTLRITLPTGGMIMFDKNTSGKIGYHEPQKIKIAVPGNEPFTVVIGDVVTEGQRRFQTKGNSPKIYWYDIY
jgi:hypothetical protein